MSELVAAVIGGLVSGIVGGACSSTFVVNRRTTKLKQQIEMNADRIETVGSQVNSIEQGRTTTGEGNVTLTDTNMRLGDNTQMNLGSGVAISMPAAAPQNRAERRRKPQRGK